MASLSAITAVTSRLMSPTVTGSALRSAAEALGTRSRTTADNIANLQTPGFIAHRVTFEDSLAAAAGRGSRVMTAPGLERSLEPTREDGNNVNLDQETLISIDTELKYQLVLRAIDDRFNALRSAIRTN